MTVENPREPEERLNEEKRYQRVQARVRKIKQFYTNLITYILVNILLIVINVLTTPGDLWFYWVSIIWGLIIVFQAFNTFTIRDQFLGSEWEERKTKELLEKEKRKEK